MGREFLQLTYTARSPFRWLHCSRYPQLHARRCPPSLEVALILPLPTILGRILRKSKLVARQTPRSLICSFLCVSATSIHSHCAPPNPLKLSCHCPTHELFRCVDPFLCVMCVVYTCVKVTNVWFKTKYRQFLISLAKLTWLWERKRTQKNQSYNGEHEKSLIQ